MGLELDEYIYGKIAKYFKAKRKANEYVVDRTVTLEEVKPQLIIIARAVTGEAIDIYPSEREGGYKNNSFFLPVSFSRLTSKEQNKAFYYFRVLYLSIQKELNLNWHVKKDYTNELSQQEAYRTSEYVLGRLFKEFKYIEEIYLQLKNYFESIYAPNSIVDYSWLYGKWMINDGHEASALLNQFSNKIKTKNELKPKTILKANAVEDIKSVEVDKKQQEDFVLLHSFEKVETAEEFDGTWRDFDGEDDLKEHSDALEELNMKFTVRVDNDTHSIYQAEFIENTNVSESAERDVDGLFIKYNEWDYSKSSYKVDFCKLYPKIQLKTDNEYYYNIIRKHHTTLMGLRKMLTNVNNKFLQQRKQLQGIEFDIDAITDMYVDIQSKRTPSENIYISNRKKEKDISILILLDVSLSSDGYVANNRVIDVEKEVSILFGEILNEFQIDFCIDSFYSKTRNHSSYLTLKDFDDKWETSKQRIGAVEPQGYTRIGTALRHAGRKLNARSTKNKWLILLSDGKPNDYDKYEGKYGINDVKQALKELNQQQIHSYALAIEAQAKYYLPQMFGQNHFQILTTSVELLTSLVKLYDKIKRIS
ncbi:MAG: VWA domain-containing protein [Bacteroidia bacterium]|nr:VWA domain-containing protein [Bacteroidia bacterium]